MRTLLVRAAFLFMAISCLAVRWAHAGSVTFPSDTSFYCNTYGCDFVGDNGGQTAAFFTAGDFVTETFFGLPTSVYNLQFDIFLIDTLGGNPGAQYQNLFYVNGVQVSSFSVQDCGYCGTTEEFTAAFDFTPIEGDGTYNLSIVLGETVPPGDGNEVFTEPGTVDFNSVPEPSSFALLGSAVVALAGLLRRRGLLR
jgi:PEP-CTERM motif